MIDKDSPLEEQIRDLFKRSPMFCENIFGDAIKFNKMCGAMDVLNDAGIAIYEFSSNPNSGYLSVYGLLQAIYLQQDSVTYMAEALGIKISKGSTDWWKIRNLRNDAVGHPMNRENDSSFHFITRSTLSDKGFEITSFDRNNNRKKRKIQFETLIQDHFSSNGDRLNDLLNKMIEIENQHRDKFRGSMVIDNFQNSGYYFEKIFDSCSNEDKFPQAKSHITYIEKMLDDFESELKQRGEFLEDSITASELIIAKHCIEKLKNIYDTDAFKVIENKLDVKVYAGHLNTLVKRLQKTAIEIDETYKKDLKYDTESRLRDIK